MKKNAFFVLAFLIGTSTVVNSQGVAINSSGSVANTSAMLDVSSTEKGLLIPRMTQAQRDLITVSNDRKGLLIYQTDNAPGFYFYDGSNWAVMGSESISINDLTDGKTGGNSVFLGSDAGTNDDGSDNRNVAVGYYALYSNTTGYYNTANGFKSLYSNTTGYKNTANGYLSLYSNTTGYENTANANWSLYSNTTGYKNTANGYLSLYSNTTGNENTANGFSSLYSNTTGDKNTANGNWSLYSNIDGNDNTANGFKSLYSNTTGYENTTNGYGSLYHNTEGYYNAATGFKSLYSNTFGYNNTANGYGSLYSNTTGDNNIGIGYYANHYNQTGNNNTIIGYEAGKGSSNHNKSGNVFLGYQAGLNETGDNRLYIENSDVSSPLIYGEFDNNLLKVNGTLELANGISASSLKFYEPSGSGTHYSLFQSQTQAGDVTYTLPAADGSNGQMLATNGSGVLSWASDGGATNINDLTDGKTGGHSVFLGSSAGASDDGSDNRNVGVGDDALYSNTTGYRNTANGYMSLYSNTEGYYNTANGYMSLYNNTTGYENTTNGYGSLYHNTTGENNTANGYKSLYSNTTGYYNTANGYKSLYSNTTGHRNTATGFKSLHSNTTGTWNSANGYMSLYNNTTGNNNTANGGSSLHFNTTGSCNTAVGEFAGSPSGSTDLNNTGAFGYDAKPTANNRIHIGNASVNWIGGQVAWSTYSDKRFKRNIKENVSGLDFIMKLRPVTYHWNIGKLNDHIGIREEAFSDEVMQQAIKDQEAVTYTGFLAQEVERAAQETGFDFSGVQAPVNEITPYSLSYAEFVVPLVKAVQELAEEVERLEEWKNGRMEEMESLRTQNINLETRLEKLEAMENEMKELKALVKQLASKNDIASNNEQ